MNLSRRELRLLGLHEYLLGHNATEAYRNICRTMGDSVVDYSTVTLWFQKFKDGNYQLDDTPHPGQPVHIDVDHLKDLIEADPRRTTFGTLQRNLAAVILQ